MTPPHKLLNLQRLQEAVDLRTQGLMYREIGERMGVSKGRAHQLFKRAVKLWTDGSVAKSLLRPIANVPGSGQVKCPGCGMEFEQTDPRLEAGGNGGPQEPSQP